MKNLGRILLLLSIGINIFADTVDSSVDKSLVTRGDLVNFSITVHSNHFTLPQITKLCGSRVLSRSTQTNLSDINGNITKNQTYIYGFSPEQSCTIKPIKIEVDGKTVQTKPIQIQVHAPLPNSDAKFSLHYQTPAKVVYVNEPFEVTLTTKLRRDMGVVDSHFSSSPMSDFWVRKQQQIKTYPAGNYIDGGVRYLLKARKEGNITIEPAQINLAFRASQANAWGSFIPQLSWKRYVSNPLHVRVKPLPTNINLVGDMNISIAVDKTKIPANGAVNATIKVTGRGNFKDIGNLKPQIPGVAVFDNDAKIKDFLGENEYHETYTKEITFVADQNFTIPSIGFSYFNTQTKEVVKLATKPINITVVGSRVKTHGKLQVIEDSAPTSTQHSSAISWILLLIVSIISLVIGIFIGLFRPWKLIKKKETTAHISIKDTKRILNRLIQHQDDPDVREMIDILEKKLYTSEEVTVDMKKLKELKKKYNI